MKLPTLIQGIQRKNRTDTIAINKGVIAQDAFCENVCHQTLPTGGKERAQCLSDCRKN
jgi:hypothetical protein